MHDPKHSTVLADSGQEEYFYQLEQASYQLKCAEKAQYEASWHMERFHRHNDWLKQYSNNFSP